MSSASMRRIAAVTASAALLSGIAAATGSAAFAAPAPHPAPAAHTQMLHGEHGEHAKGDRDKGDHGRHLGWEKGVDKKKDHWDGKAHCWQRFDADSRTYAQWDERSHCWKRKVNGHWQKWDTAHKAWK